MDKSEYQRYRHKTINYVPANSYMHKYKIPRYFSEKDIVKLRKLKVKGYVDRELAREFQTRLSNIYIHLRRISEAVKQIETEGKKPTDKRVLDLLFPASERNKNLSVTTAKIDKMLQSSSPEEYLENEQKLKIPISYKQHISKVWLKKKGFTYKQLLKLRMARNNSLKAQQAKKAKLTADKKSAPKKAGKKTAKKVAKRAKK